MEYRDSSEEAAFRRGLQEWLAANVAAMRPAGSGPGWQEAASREEADRLYRQWHTSLYQAGYMGMSWPVEYGGRGLSPVYDAILNEEVGRADAPRLPIIGHLGRAIYRHGSEAQRRRFLPTLLNGEVRWCQGFSEPDAGSDVASLRTRAERVDDHYLVNGQKMWTSLALDSDWCLLLARTDPHAPRHRGISCLLVSMRTPGVTVAPITLATGNSETCMTFWDNVLVPAEQMLGPAGGGWNIAMTTLSQERGPSNQGFLATYRRRLSQAEELAHNSGVDGQPEVRKRLADAYVRGEVLRLVALEQLSAQMAGDAFGPEGSVAKLLWTQADQTVNHLKIDLAGAAGLTGRGEHLADYLGSRQASVYGGTSQIQRNILAANILDMPRSGRPAAGGSR